MSAIGNTPPSMAVAMAVDDDMIDKENILFSSIAAHELSNPNAINLPLRGTMSKQQRASPKTAPQEDQDRSEVQKIVAKIVELQTLKDQRIANEDNMAARHVKQWIQEQAGSKVVEGADNNMPVPMNDDKDDIYDEQADDSINSEWHLSPETGLMELQDSAGKDSALKAPFSLPRETFERLHEYQRAGVTWMARLLQKNQGGILADEMGLGKTVQLCSLLDGARKAGATHALLFLPITLFDQWKREARIWCPGWAVHCYHGSPAQKAYALRKVSLPTGGLLITSYGLIANDDQLNKIIICNAAKDTPNPKKKNMEDEDVDEKKSEDEQFDPEVPLNGVLQQNGVSIPWDIVIADEAHKMKNISTLLGRSLRNIESKSRVLLTGTPVQNALGDLWSLMDFAQPGLLGNHATFTKHFIDPIERGSVRHASASAVELKKHLGDQMRALIDPHLLRRTTTATGLVTISAQLFPDEQLHDDHGGNAEVGADYQQMAGRDDDSPRQTLRTGYVDQLIDPTEEAASDTSTMEVDSMKGGFILDKNGFGKSGKLEGGMDRIGCGPADKGGESCLLNGDKYDNDDGDEYGQGREKRQGPADKGGEYCLLNGGNSRYDNDDGDEYGQGQEKRQGPADKGGESCLLNGGNSKYDNDDGDEYTGRGKKIGSRAQPTMVASESCRRGKKRDFGMGNACEDGGPGMAASDTSTMEVDSMKGGFILDKSGFGKSGKLEGSMDRIGCGPADKGGESDCNGGKYDNDDGDEYGQGQEIGRAQPTRVASHACPLVAMVKTGAAEWQWMTAKPDTCASNPKENVSPAAEQACEKAMSLAAHGSRMPTATGPPARTPTDFFSS